MYCIWTIAVVLGSIRGGNRSSAHFIALSITQLRVRKLFVIDDVVLDDGVANELAELLERGSGRLPLHDHVADQFLQSICGLARTSSFHESSVALEAGECVSHDSVVRSDLFKIEGVVSLTNLVDNIEDVARRRDPGPVELHDVATVADAVDDHGLVLAEVMHVTTKEKLRHL